MGRKALILVDLQNDFCPGGGLPVEDGHLVIPLANELQSKFDVVVATQDWHPRDHMSFAANHPGSMIGQTLIIDGRPQVMWPVHCVRQTHGAAFHLDLELHASTKIFYKGTDSRIDSYSAFFDNAHLRSTGLADYLRQEQVTDVYLMGLAMDYCVKYSALDAVHTGFNVFVIEDACRGVELRPGDCEAALNEMKLSGIQIIQSDDVLHS